MLFQFVQSDLGKRTKGEEVEYINILDVKTIRRLTLLFIAIHIYIILQLQSSLHDLDAMRDFCVKFNHIEIC